MFTRFKVKMRDANGSDGNLCEINKLHGILYTDGISWCIWMPLCPFFCFVGSIILHG